MAICGMWKTSGDYRGKLTLCNSRVTLVSHRLCRVLTPRGDSSGDRSSNPLPVSEVPGVLDHTFQAKFAQLSISNFGLDRKFYMLESRELQHYYTKQELLNIGKHRPVDMETGDKTIEKPPFCEKSGVSPR
jgi:hypothetical protein